MVSLCRSDDVKLQLKEMGDSQVPKETLGQSNKVNDIIKDLAEAISKRLAGRSLDRGGGELPYGKFAP